jgi:tetratricopeptide (TPR) repeat protein
MLFLVLLAADFLASGQQALLSGDYSRAETAFREHLKTHPDSAEGLSNLATVLSRREQFPEAIALYRQALRADPKLTQVWFNLAVAQIRSGRCGEATASLGSFLKHHPEELRGRELLGLCLVETGALAGAVAELEKVYAAKPADPGVLFSLAYANARSGNEERALQLLAAMEAWPAKARLIEGLVEARRGRFAEAKAKYEEVVRLEPSNAGALAALGRLHLLENRDPQAIEFLERAVKLSARDAESTYQLGVLYDRNGRAEEGRQMLRRAIDLRANYADPHYQLGRIAFRDRRYPEALAELQTAAKILPDHEAIRFLLGRTYQALGRMAAANAEFAEVRRLKRVTIERAQKRVESEIPLEP